MTIADLLKKYEPELAKAFQAGIDEITSKAQIGQIVSALESGNIAEAIEAIFLDAAAFSEFERVLNAAYVEGGKNTIDGLSLRDQSGSAFVVRFDGRNPRAERWLANHSSDLVTRIVTEQRDILRETLQQGLIDGRNPRSTALDIVGRIDKRTKRRAGGIVGLSKPQAEAVVKARQELISGEYADYLKRTKRDARFDSLLRRAARDGKPLSDDKIDKITNRYSDRLLKLRGDTIARTETIASLHAGQHEGLKQIVDTGKVNANQIRRVWDATGDKRTRADHMEADGQSVGLDEPFTVGGVSMLHPGDPSGGAAQVINCRCALNVRIDYFANVQ